MYTLSQAIELHEGTSVITRENLLALVKKPDQRNHFVTVIFAGPVDLEVYVSYPTCVLEKFDQYRLKYLLNLPASITTPEEVSDKLRDFFFLTSLSDEIIEELKAMFKVKYLEDVTRLKYFWESGTYCDEKYMSLSLKRKLIVLDTLPENPNYFCWLQLLPLIKSYPSLFLGKNEVEYEVKDVKMFTKKYSVISEQLSTTATSTPNENDYLYFLRTIPSSPNDLYSILYGNQTDYDLCCFYNQCKIALGKIGSDKPFQSYRLRFLNFLLTDPKAKLPYIALKLYKHLQNEHSFLWYR